jgi:hypothetical protein
MVRSMPSIPTTANFISKVRQPKRNRLLSMDCGLSGSAQVDCIQAVKDSATNSIPMEIPPKGIMGQPMREYKRALLQNAFFHFACLRMRNTASFGDFRCWPKADMGSRTARVRFQGQSRHGFFALHMSANDPKRTWHARWNLRKIMHCKEYRHPLGRGRT